MDSKLAILCLLSCSLLAVDTTFLGIRACDTGGEWIDTNPQQGEDRCKEDGPNNNNGRCTVLPTHETLKEGVQVDNHPEGKEELPKERTP
ncbi:Os03g0808150 [Oryza sativa Japonica Group]|uniref:Os03g0808150 protein n=1 Tax=Oryza sativa subsp. japonica TaxID=39947 RepID=A0A0P0W4K3_ORYSJ|nr:hypothetical protein EE612_021165 [Oryza sativa]BAS86967.1 Os03g0808150 [Oryza sativa Japonica Group]